MSSHFHEAITLFKMDSEKEQNLSRSNNGFLYFVACIGKLIYILIET